MTDEIKAVAKQEAPIKPPLVAGGRSMAIVPRDIEQTFRLAQAIAAANMAPKAYERDANRIMVGIMHGMEVGLTPMAALQSIAVVNGMPTIWGDGMLAVVRASGLCEWIEETIEGKGDARVAVCRAKRKGEPKPIERRFSWQQAILAGLAGKPGPWTQHPDRMLQFRARSYTLRDGFADVLRGLASAEEARDSVPLTAGDDGVYTTRPTRAQYEAPEPPDMDRAYRQAMGETVDEDTGEIVEAEAVEDEPEPAPQDTRPDAAPAVTTTAPVLLPTRETPDGTIDWQGWLADARSIIEAAPSSDWISEWRQLHTATLGSLQAKSPKTHAAFIKFVNDTRSALSPPPE